jgi:hypothetical protein
MIDAHRLPRGSSAGCRRVIQRFRRRLEYNRKQNTAFGFDDVERIYTFIAANRMLWASRAESCLWLLFARKSDRTVEKMPRLRQ